VPSPSRHRRLLAEASDAQTPPARMAELAASRYREVRCAVASNPGAPVGVLKGLLGEFPREVTHNASWPLETLINPALQALTRPSLARSSVDPRELLELARDEQPSTRALVAQNPACPPEALVLLAREQDPQLRLHLAKNPACPREALALLGQGLTEDRELFQALAAHPSTPPELLTRLADEHLAKMASERQEQARQGRGWFLSTHWLTVLVWQLLRNPSTRADDLRRLIAAQPDMTSHLLAAVLENPAIPGDLLAAAASAPELRRRVAGHRGAPGELLASLATDKDPDVRRAVASNPSTPPAVLDALARTTSGVLRRRVAENPSCSPETRQRLARSR